MLFVNTGVALSQTDSRAELDTVKMRSLLKILSQNQNLDFSRLDSIRLVIPFPAGDASARQTAAHYFQLTKDLNPQTLHGKKIHARPLSTDSLDQIDWPKYHGVLFLKSDSAFVKLMKDICVAYRLLSLSFQPKLLENGVSAAVDIPAESNEPQFWFNLAGIRLEGAEFKADVLRLASYIRDGDRTLKVD